MAGWRRGAALAGAFFFGVALVALGVFFARQGLERANAWAGVLGAFVGLIGLGVALYGLWLARRSVATSLPAAPSDGQSEDIPTSVIGELRAGEDAIGVTVVDVHDISEGSIKGSLVADGTVTDATVVKGGNVGRRQPRPPSAPNTQP
jgi:hypothetical protein